MLCRPDHRALDLGPVDTGIERLVDEPDHAHGIASDDVHAQGHLGRRLAILAAADHALDRAPQDLARTGPRRHAARVRGQGRDCCRRCCTGG